jgi:hypothetical protein
VTPDDVSAASFGVVPLLHALFSGSFLSKKLMMRMTLRKISRHHEGLASTTK